MKIIRFRARGSSTAYYGVCNDDHVSRMAAEPYGGLTVETSETYPLEEIELLAPCQPSKIVALGLNYRDHAQELGMALPEEPLLFLKPPSAVVGPGADIVLPRMSQRVDHEAELGVVIGTKAKRVSAEDAKRSILGYTCVNDVTARDLQKRDVQFTRAKSFDTFCPVGPWIVTDLDPGDLVIQCRVNGELRQSSRTSQLIHPVEELVSFISHIMTLEPGDIIATGTPSGIGQLREGDEVVVVIEGLGELKNTITQDSTSE
jgi:2-keto-4-pentenoate hydratase/2-oxohepta-3-ene-1,7-dioic acid hydratase in catechol pathway